MAQPIGIAAVAAPFGRDLEQDLLAVERLIERAREQDASLLVLPECAIGGYLREPGDAHKFLDLPPALDADGPEIRRLARLAGDMVVVAGYTERGDGDELFSSAVCVGGGEVLGRQRKVHLPPAERFAYTPGEGFAAFDTPVGRLGMMVCYDKLFPEAARALVLDGAEVVCSIAAWSVDRHNPARRMAADKQTRHFDVVDQARAIENQVVWVSANQTGRWGSLHFLGGSKVVDPDGVVRATTGNRPGLAVAQLDVAAALETSTLHIDHLADRRPEAYGVPTHPASLALAER